MNEWWVQLTVSNVTVSCALALVAFAVQRSGAHPRLSHFCWLLVLAKLVIPPIFTMPLIPVEPSELSSFGDVGATDGIAVTVAEFKTIGGTPVELPDASVSLSGWVLILWSAVTLLVVARSFARSVRFRRLLRSSSVAVPSQVHDLAADVAGRMRVRIPFSVVGSTASLSPFVWWFGGRVELVLPDRVVARLSREELSMVLAHELAHVRRRDHWVRWLEWLATVTFWWNPILWWARHNLRIHEELACDLLVLEAIDPERRRYASSLLSVAEILSTEAIRPPSVASAMTRGGSLEQRLTMIISKTMPKAPRLLLSAILAVGAGVLPLNVTYAQDFDAVQRRLGGAVEAGEITLEQAQIMMDALRRSVRKERRQRGGERDVDARKKRFGMFERRVKNAVESGDLSRMDAEKKLVDMRRQLFGDSGQKRGDVAAKRRFSEVEREIKEAVRAGTLSKRDAEKKLLAVRKEMFEGQRDDTKRDRKRGDESPMRDARRRFGEFEREIEAAVRDGKISKRDAQKKLVELREKMSEMTRRSEETRKQFEGVQRRLEAAVERGDLTREEAKKKLVELRKSMADDSKPERRSRERRRRERTPR